jgi:hypothetical protein
MCSVVATASLLLVLMPESLPFLLVVFISSACRGSGGVSDGGSGSDGTSTATHTHTHRNMTISLGGAFLVLLSSVVYMRVRYDREDIQWFRGVLAATAGDSYMTHDYYPGFGVIW